MKQNIMLQQSDTTRPTSASYLNNKASISAANKSNRKSSGLGSDGGKAVSFSAKGGIDRSRKARAVINFSFSKKRVGLPMMPHRIAHFDEAYAYEPDVPTIRKMVLDHANEVVRATDQDGFYQIKKWCYFSISIASALIGVALTLLGLAETDAFNSYSPNKTVFWVSMVFYFPLLIWLKVVFFPGWAERKWRRYVLDMRLWRRKVKAEQRRNFYEDNEDEGDGFGPPKPKPKEKGPDIEFLKKLEFMKQRAEHFEKQRSEYEKVRPPPPKPEYPSKLRASY